MAVARPSVAEIHDWRYHRRHHGARLLAGRRAEDPGGKNELAFLLSARISVPRTMRAGLHPTNVKRDPRNDDTNMPGSGAPKSWEGCEQGHGQQYEWQDRQGQDTISVRRIS